MYRKRNIRVVSACAILFASMVMHLPASFGQTTAGEQDAPDEPESSEVIDEIIVYTEKSLPLLRLQQQIAEEKVFAMFNELNSDDEYDIHCYWEVPTGSIIRQRFCRPNFVKDAQSYEAWRFLSGTGTLGGPRSSSAAATIARKNRRVQEEMEALVISRPDFRRVVLELADATDVLEAERKRKCEGAIVVCRK